MKAEKMIRMSLVKLKKNRIRRDRQQKARVLKKLKWGKILLEKVIKMNKIE